MVYPPFVKYFPPVRSLTPKKIAIEQQQEGKTLYAKACYNPPHLILAELQWNVD